MGHGVGASKCGLEGSGGRSGESIYPLCLWVQVQTFLRNPAHCTFMRSAGPISSAAPTPLPPPQTTTRPSHPSEGFYFPAREHIPARRPVSHRMRARARWDCPDRNKKYMSTQVAHTAWRAIEILSEHTLQFIFLCCDLSRFCRR